VAKLGFGNAVGRGGVRGGVGDWDEGVFEAEGAKCEGSSFLAISFVRYI